MQNDVKHRKMPDREWSRHADLTAEYYRELSEDDRPLFGKSKVRLKVSGLAMRDVGIVPGGPKTGLVAAGRLVNHGSFVEFDVPAYSPAVETLSGGTRVFIVEHERPGVIGECGLGANGERSWKFYTRVSPDHFYHIRRHITGIDPLSGEQMRSNPITYAIEINGCRFAPLNPNDRSDLSFVAEIESLLVGGWRVD